MRYVSGFLFATAAAAHTSALANALGIALLVGAGVVALLFAVEAIVRETRPRHTTPPSCTSCATPHALLADAAKRDERLRDWFNQPPR